MTLPSNPVTGQIGTLDGRAFQCVDGAAKLWNLIEGLGPAVKVTPFDSAGAFTPSLGARYFAVLAWGSTNAGVPEMAVYTAGELGASAAVVIGDGGGSPTDTTFTPDGTGATLTAPGATGDPGKLFVIEFLGASYGSMLDQAVPIGDIRISFDKVAQPGCIMLEGGTITDGAIDFLWIAARYPEMVSGDDLIVPDFRGLGLRVWDNGAGVDPDAASRTANWVGGPTGDNPGSEQADGAPNITGTISSNANRPVFDAGTGAFSVSNSSSSFAISGPSGTLLEHADFDASASNAKYGAASEIRGANIYITAQMRLL